MSSSGQLCVCIPATLQCTCSHSLATDLFTTEQAAWARTNCCSGFLNTNTTFPAPTCAAPSRFCLVQRRMCQGWWRSWPRQPASSRPRPPMWTCTSSWPSTSTTDQRCRSHQMKSARPLSPWVHTQPPACEFVSLNAASCVHLTTTAMSHSFARAMAS